MTEIFSTLHFQHDLRLVLLAAAICALSAFACISMLAHARRSGGTARLVWIAVAAVAVGFGIWATHFVAMLAFDIGFPAGYDVGLTLASLVIAIAVGGIGIAMATIGNGRSDMVLGGGIVGLGISGMHYTGMLALQVGGDVVWNPLLAVISIVAGMTLGGLALRLGASRKPRARLAATGLLTLAVCSMHFTAMGAANFENCYPIAVAEEIRPGLLALLVALGSIFILLAALGALFLDLRERRRARTEESRMRGLADAAVEGLVVCDGRTIVAVNASFQNLLGPDDIDVANRSIGEFLAPTGCFALFEKPDTLVETELTALSGERIPVEAVMRRVDFGGHPHHAIAIRDLRARKAAEHHIRFLAHHDPMTGLANRMSFNQRLADEIARAGLADQRLAVMWIDLDRFKEVNDLFGHAAGDALLQKAAAIIGAELADTQLAARLGGDEFALILPDIGTRERAGEAARSLLDAFAQAERTDDRIAVAASIGIAVYPEDAQEADALVTCADMALYNAKSEGRGTWRSFEPAMGAQVRHRRQFERDLRVALAGGQLTLAYQPQVDLETGAVTGFEALLRWHHPERGAIPPGRFIPIAEESGLILQIGEWVMRAACTEAASWTRPLTVAVNVSAVQLHAETFPDYVRAVLAETGLDPARLEIEITETAMIRNMNRALSSLRQVKAMGVKVAMDDFGTGYSSLSNLRAFPFDRIKVDQSFIRAIHTNPQSAAIVRAVLGLGKGLNLPILAEGVERPEELEFLRNEVCNGAQGYWFGQPQAISVYEDIVRGTQTILDPVEEPERRASA